MLTSVMLGSTAFKDNSIASEQVEVELHLFSVLFSAVSSSTKSSPSGPLLL